MAWYMKPILETEWVIWSLQHAMHSSTVHRHFSFSWCLLEGKSFVLPLLRTSHQKRHGEWCGSKWSRSGAVLLLVVQSDIMHGIDLMLLHLQHLSIFYMLSIRGLAWAMSCLCAFQKTATWQLHIICVVPCKHKTGRIWGGTCLSISLQGLFDNCIAVRAPGSFCYFVWKEKREQKSRTFLFYCPF